MTPEPYSGAMEWFRHLIIAYGESGAGKTPFGTRLPAWMRPFLYLAYDPTSKSFESVLPEDEEWMVPYVPDGQRVPIFSTPFDEAKLWARAEWESWGAGTRECLGAEAWEFYKRKHPGGLRTLVLDGVTHLAEMDFEWQKEHLTNKEGKPVEDNRQYYNETQQAVNTVYTTLQVCHAYRGATKPGMHVVWLAQIGEHGEKNDRIRGPQTVGRQGPVMLPHRFNTTLYLSRMRDPIHNPEGRMRVLLAPERPYIATVKKADTEDSPSPVASEMYVRNTHRAVEEVYEYLMNVKMKKTSGPAVKEDAK